MAPNAWPRLPPSLLRSFTARPPALQILESNGLDYPFPPMPAEKRRRVLAWRAEQNAQAAAAAQAEAAQQAQQEAEAAPARQHKKLRRAGEVEQEALRDEMEDGSPPVATLGTQRHKRKPQQVLSDSEDEGEGSEGDGEDSRPLAHRVQQQQQQQRPAPRTPVVQLASDSEPSPPAEQQQPKKQRPGAGERREHAVWLIAGACWAGHACPRLFAQIAIVLWQPVVVLDPLQAVMQVSSSSASSLQQHHH